MKTSPLPLLQAIKLSVPASLMFCLLVSPGCRASDPKAQPSDKAPARIELPGPLQNLSLQNLPSQIELKYSWTGVGGRVPDHLYHLKYLPQQKQYQVRHERISQTGVIDQKTSSSLSPDLVSRVLKTLGPAGWVPTKEAVSVMTHTDDYPVYRLRFNVDPKHPVELFSMSSTPNAVPWNLSYDKKLFTSDNQDFGIAASQLFEQLGQTSKTK